MINYRFAGSFHFFFQISLGLIIEKLVSCLLFKLTALFDCFQISANRRIAELIAEEYRIKADVVVEYFTVLIVFFEVKKFGSLYDVNTEQPAPDLIGIELFVLSAQFVDDKSRMLDDLLYWFIFFTLDIICKLIHNGAEVGHSVRVLGGVISIQRLHGRIELVELIFFKNIRTVCDS